MMLKSLLTTLMKQWWWLNAVHLALLRSSWGSIIYSYLHFCLCFHPYQNAAQDLVLYGWSWVICKCCSPPLHPYASSSPTINANQAYSNLTWTETEPRRIVSSRQKAEQKSRLPHHSSKLSCSVFFWESDYKSVGERCAEGNVRHIVLVRFLGLLKATALVKTIPRGTAPLLPIGR